MSPEIRIWTKEEMSYKEIAENPVKLDFTGCRRGTHFYKILREGLGLPDCTGENMDALWDYLQGVFDEPLVVELRGLGDLPKEFDDTVRLMLEVFDDVHKESPHVEFVRVS